MLPRVSAFSVSRLWRSVGRFGRTDQPDRDVRVDRICYALAIALTVTWVVVFNRTLTGALVDEPGHVGAIYHFLEGKSGWPESMPMLPGYHFIVLSWWKFFPAMNPLTAARFTTTFITLVGFAAFAVACQRVQGGRGGRSLLLLALLPLIQPFTGMAYTDMPAAAFVLVALWAQVTGRRAFAAVAMLGAITLRQTNVIWAGFLIAWEFFRADEPKATLPRRLGWQVLVIAIVGVAGLMAGRLTPGTQHGNAFTFNLTAIHFGAILVLVLGLPVWVAHLPATFRRTAELMRTRPFPTVLVATFGLMAAAILGWRFTNAHGWNRDLWWEGCSFTLLRNWPLVGIDAHGWAKALSGLNVVLMIASLGWVVIGQRHRLALGLAVAVGMLPVVTNGLVEPRYFIPGAVVFLLFLEIPPADFRRLAGWWAVLSAIHAPFVANALSLW